MSIAVLGAGAFGTALAISLAKGEQGVLLWARDPEHAKSMQSERMNTARLPKAPFPESLRVACDLDTIKGIQTVLIAVPMQQLARFAQDNRQVLAGKILVACCKGIDLTTGLGPTAVLKSVLPDTPRAILTGPSFAHDIAIGLPTALTLACEDATLGTQLQHDLSSANLRLYRSVDVVGAELGGALKNVIAIACGATIGAGLGESARAALITRGFAEMQRMAQAVGAKPETLAGLSGFGDLALTCASEGSRNFRFGLSLGRGEAFDPSITVEGAATAKACLARAKALNLDMPITAAVVAMIEQTLTLKEAMDTLLARPLKEETC
ncbi:MAG: NAD(P)H-dependent glycerol-3-phosphate dehydrogenase [Planktotalea sp.]|uniref:NAD(P)H-dependent glycerol-3-phosphate dehydrogenase n=1 Tax=Planktotalea sp. TaxID=2029877 RepID=UPI003C7759DF